MDVDSRAEPASSVVQEQVCDYTAYSYSILEVMLPPPFDAPQCRELRDWWLDYPTQQPVPRRADRGCYGTAGRSSVALVRRDICQRGPPRASAAHAGSGREQSRAGRQRFSRSRAVTDQDDRRTQPSKYSGNTRRTMGSRLQLQRVLARIDAAEKNAVPDDAAITGA